MSRRSRHRSSAVTTPPPDAAGAVAGEVADEAPAPAASIEPASPPEVGAARAAEVVREAGATVRAPQTKADAYPRRKDTLVRALASLPWHGLIREAGTTFRMPRAEADALSARGRVEIVTE
jgi:hypothetical protein